MKKLILTTLLFLFPALAVADNDSYYVPPAQFNASLQIMDLGFANIMALFQSSTGEFSYDDAAKSITNLRIAIDATSLMTTNPDNLRALSQLFALRQYPEMRITSLAPIEFKDGKAVIKANVAWHNVNKTVDFDAVINRTGKSPRNTGLFSGSGDAIGLSLHGAFNRADFGMTDNPEEASRFGDMITLQLEMQALKQ